MAGDAITIRPARRQDAAELAILVDLASHGFASWMWYAAVARGEADTPLECGRRRLMDDALDGGWKDALIAEIDGQVAGASIAHRLTPALLGDPGNPILAPIVALQRQVPESWFVDSLAVYSANRRRGVARRLLENERARGGARSTALITESHNDRALRLYEKVGFRRQAEQDAVRLSEAWQPHRWILMLRQAAN